MVSYKQVVRRYGVNSLFSLVFADVIEYRNRAPEAQPNIEEYGVIPFHFKIDLPAPRYLNKKLAIR